MPMNISVRNKRCNGRLKQDEANTTDQEDALGEAMKTSFMSEMITTGSPRSEARTVLSDTSAGLVVWPASSVASARGMYCMAERYM